MLKQFIIIGFSFLLCLSCTTRNKPETEITSSENMDKTTNSDESEIYLIVGTYTEEDSNGIYIYRFDTISGSSRLISTVKEQNPSYLTLTKDEKYVYTISENKGSDALISAFLFDKEKGELKFINKQLIGGDDPCYVSVDETGKHIVTANYSGGNISIFSAKENGALNPASQVINFTGSGYDSKRQSKPHLHSVVFSPDYKFLFAADLGTDKIHKFETLSNSENYLKLGTPAAFNLSGGSGPRHFEFHPNGKFAYLITEISGNVIAFDYDEVKGNLTEIQTIKADSLNAAGSADIHISPDGKFLYASNRLKGDGIAIFLINESDGKLTKTGYQETGIHPRNFVITPNGEFLLVANRDSDNIQVFKRNKNNGLLVDTHQNIELSMPVCLKFGNIK